MRIVNPHKEEARPRRCLGSKAQVQTRQNAISLAEQEEERVLAKGREEAAAVGQGAEGRVTEAAKAVETRVLEKYGVTAL